MVVASGEAGKAHAQWFAGWGALVFLQGRGFVLLREIAGKLQDCRIGLAPSKQVGNSVDGPLLAT